MSFENDFIKKVEDLWESYKNELIPKRRILRDSNKEKVDRFLVPFLRTLSQDMINAFTERDFSYTAFKIRLPLLIECKKIDREHCKKEIAIGNSKVYRYYIEPYNINGKYYHVCSQWANTGNEESKDWLIGIANAMSNKENKD